MRILEPTALYYFFCNGGDNHIITFMINSTLVRLTGVGWMYLQLYQRTGVQDLEERFHPISLMHYHGAYCIQARSSIGFHRKIVCNRKEHV